MTVVNRVRAPTAGLMLVVDLELVETRRAEAGEVQDDNAVVAPKSRMLSPS